MTFGSSYQVRKNEGVREIDRDSTVLLSSVYLRSQTHLHRGDELKNFIPYLCTLE